MALVCIMCIAGSVSVRAQDPHFSQFTNCIQQYNPAMTGQFDQTVKATLVHKKQWGNIGKGYTTNGLDAQYKLLSLYSENYAGIGLLVLQDNAGKAQQKTFGIKASVAYHLIASKKNLLSGGIQLGYDQRSIDVNGLAWDAQYNGITYDPTLDDKEKFASVSKGAVDIGAGIAWRHKGKRRYTLGYAIHHTGQQIAMLARSSDKLGIRQTWHATLFKRNDQYELRYDALVQRQSGAMEIMAGFTFDYRIGSDSRYTTTQTSSGIRAGAFYRYRDAIHPFVGFDFKRYATLSFGYDIRMAKMPVVTKKPGGPEIMLTYLASFGKKRVKIVH